MAFWENVLGKLIAILKAAIVLAVFVGIQYAVYYAFGYLSIDRNIYSGVYNFLCSLLAIAAMLITCKIATKKEKQFISIKKLFPDQAAAVVILAVGMLGFVTLYIIVADLIADYIKSMQEAMVEYRENIDRYSEVVEKAVVPLWDTLLYIFTLCIIVPVAEELVFRGVVIGFLKKAFKPWAAILISAAGFGLLHGVSVHIGYALICGILIASSYYLTESLIAPILMHMLFNIFGSGVSQIMSIEQLRIPENVSGSIMVGLNTSTLLLMPIAVLAFAYLVSVKRKRDAERKVLGSGNASVEDGEVTEEINDSSDKMNIEETE